MLLKMKCTHTTFTEGRDVSVAYFAWIWQVFPHPILIAITFNNNTMLKTEYSRSYNNTAVIRCSPIRKLRLCWISNKKQHGKKSEQNSLHSGMYIPAKIDPIQKVEIITIPNTSSNGWKIRSTGTQQKVLAAKFGTEAFACLRSSRRRLFLSFRVWARMYPTADG